MGHSICSILQCDGFVFLKEHQPSQSAEFIFDSMGLITIPGNVKRVQSLRPRPESNQKNTYSGNYGFDSFPLHTDLAHWFLPPRYFSLRCISGSPTVETQLLDSRLLISDVGENSLSRTLAIPRRPINGTLPLLRILERHSSSELAIRWDKLFITPATRFSEGVFDAIESVLTSLSVITITLSNPGDTVIIDNWRMLHGRSAVPVSFRTRHIQRCYFCELY